ncbi:MAG: hypothetical protein K0R10_219 [Alphaproteobacteria bacterium]|jgi:hypothetical protein|nr:hypothetical protein [Alphaproteobacteria bacterium]
MDPITKVLTEALDKMGDLSGATVTLIDDTGDFNPGNQKAAQLLEVFNTPARGNAPRNVTIVTRYLGQDSEQGFQITGVPPGFVGSDSQPGILKERFAQVNRKPFNNKMFPVIAELMVDETPLPDTMREGMRAIVMDHMSQGGFRVDSGLGNLRDFVNGYLKREMTPEWEKRLINNAPVTQVVNTMQQGLQGCVTAPTTARFTRKGNAP